MNRLALFLTPLALSGGLAAQAQAAPETEVIKSLNDKIAALESRVKFLENALEEQLGAADSNPVAPEVAPTPASPTKPIVSTPAKPAAQPQRTYVIKEGDTISEIARRHDVVREDLMAANGLKEGQQIYIGDELIIPVLPPEAPAEPEKMLAEATKTTAPVKPAPAVKPKADPAPSAPKPATPSTPGTYTVRRGDTLSSIARKHNISVAALKSTNGLKSDRINISQKLKLPGGEPAPKTEIAKATPAPSKPSTPAQQAPKPDAGAPKTELADGTLLRSDETYGLYTIERGDTLYSLARDFFTTELELQRLNKMNGSTVLHPGKDIVVPTGKYYEHHSSLAKR